MKLSGHIESGFYRSMRAWKGILIVWFVILILASAISIPLKGSLTAAFGRSMITEKLINGIDPEVFTDLGSTFGSIMSSISSGILFIIVTSIIINAFLFGGLFGIVRRQRSDFSATDFFKACASGFWTFFFIALTITIIILFIAVLFIAVSSVAMQSSETMSETAALIIGIGASILFLLILPIFLLAADYARALRLSSGKGSFLANLGSGFSITFNKFWKSYFMMLFMMAIQGLLFLIILKIIPSWHPATNLSMFVFFVVSQALFYVRLFFRTWRYAAVTSVMEENMQDPWLPQ